MIKREIIQIIHLVFPCLVPLQFYASSVAFNTNWRERQTSSLPNRHSMETAGAIGIPQRVQALAEVGLSHLPPQYVQPPELRPDLHRRDAAHPGGVPVVDLDPSVDPLPGIRRACAGWGAFQVVNHGVPAWLPEEMKAAGLGFFRSPMETKLQYACDPGAAASEGYGSRMLTKDDGVLDWRDYFDHHTLPESRRNPSRWPDFPHNYRW